MKDNKILIINSGWEQVDLIQAAKNEGLYVVATDVSANAEGFAIADERFQIDPRNLTDLLVLAQEKHIDAVIADQCDYSFYAAAYIAERLGLPGAGLKTMQKCTNKKWMREACARNGIVQPKFRSCKNIEEVMSAVEDIGYPAIIKPLDNRGNFGVNKIEDSSQLEESFFEAVANSHSRECLVEQFIEGTMITVDGFAFNGEHRSLAVASKVMLGGRKRVAMQIMYPAMVAEDVIYKLMQNHNAVSSALDISFGCSHGEYMLTDSGDIYLIECANRGGGCFTSSKILPAVSGYNISNLLILSALGRPLPSAMQNPEMKGAAVMSFFNLESGKIVTINGIDALLKDKAVLALRMAVKPGDTVLNISNDANRHGFVIVKGDTVEEALEKIEMVKRGIKIQYA